MKQEELGLERVDREQGLQGLSVRYFEQHNSKLSRKQVAPILMQFFETM